MKKDIEYTKKINGVRVELMRFAYKLTGRHDDAQDLFQDSIIKAYKNWDKCADMDRFNSWIKTILHNTFINNYKKRKRRRLIFSGVTEVDCPVIKMVTHNMGETRLHYNQMLKEVAKLGDTYEEPLLMYAEGYSYEEIANEFNLPLGTVKSRLNFARKKLENNVAQLNYTQHRKAS